MPGMTSGTAIGRVHQISVNPAGGVPKSAIEATRIEVDHVAGDKQRHLEFHGGPTRAVCLFSLERIEALRSDGHPIRPGTVGENLTLSGIDWEQVVPGARLSIGDEVELEITQFTVPCRAISRSFKDGQSKRISQPLFPGWARVYASVLRTGTVRRGDAVSLTPVAAALDLDSVA